VCFLCLLCCLCLLCFLCCPLSSANRFYHVTGPHSPPNKAGFYKGTFFSEKVNRDAFYVWDAAKAQGYVTGHNDGECGGAGTLDSRNKYDRYYVGAVTHQYLNDYENQRPNIDALFPPLFCQAAKRVKNHAANFRGFKKIKPTCTGYRCSAAEVWQAAYIPAPVCIGHRDLSQHALSGMYRFFQANRGKRRMYSTAIVAPHTFALGDIGADQTLKFALQRFLHEYGNNTAILLWSDHGYHYGTPHKFKEGRQIHRAPFLYMTVPQQFLARHSNIAGALQHNTKQVTTHTDAYRTMLDMMGVPNLYSNHNTFGQTLFQKIETERTCAEMGIVHGYCDISVDTCSVADSDLRIVERTWKGLLANATAKLGVNVCKDVLADWKWDNRTFECVSVKGSTSKALFISGASESTEHSAILRVALDSAAVKVEHISRVDAFKPDKDKCLDALQAKGGEGKDSLLSDQLQRYYYALCMC
jgi:Protein of unknown function (DUF229)